MNPDRQMSDEVTSRTSAAEGNSVVSTEAHGRAEITSFGLVARLLLKACPRTNAVNQPATGAKLNIPRLRAESEECSITWSKVLLTRLVLKCIIHSVFKMLRLCRDQLLPRKKILKQRLTVNPPANSANDSSWRLHKFHALDSATRFVKLILSTKKVTLKTAIEKEVPQVNNENRKERENRMALELYDALRKEVNHLLEQEREYLEQPRVSPRVINALHRKIGETNSLLLEIAIRVSEDREAQGEFHRDPPF
jgi:hypothetical protein